MQGRDRLDVIYNPKSSWPQRVRRVRELLGGAVSLREVPTRGPGDARRLAREAARRGARRLVVAGGDGTLNEVLNGLGPEFAVEIGVLPLGTGNDFYRSWGDPGDLVSAVAALRRWKTTPVDLVRLEDGKGVRYFVNCSTGGFSTAVGERLTAGTKESWGALAYTVTAAGALPEMKAHRVTVIVDDDGPITADALNVLVANGSFVGGGVPVAPGALLDDGRLDLLVVRDAPVPRLMALMVSLIAGDPADDTTVIHRRATRLRLEADPVLQVNADGEAAGSTPLSYEVLAGALRFAAP